MKELTEDQLLRILANTARIAEEHGRTVSAAQSGFLTRLITYAAGISSHQEDFDRVDDPLIVSLSIDGMATELGVPKRTVTQAVKDLTNAGILIRRPGKEKKPGRGVSPMVTEIKREVYHAV